MLILLKTSMNLTKCSCVRNQNPTVIKLGNVCVERACQSCGVPKLEAKLLTLNFGGNENISWQLWKYVKEEYIAKTGEGKNIKYLYQYHLHRLLGRQ